MAGHIERGGGRARARRRASKTCACALGLLSALPFGAARAESIHVAGSEFQDARGAVVVLRGLDVAGDAKVPPFRPIDDPKLLDPLPGLGVNVARLLFTWEAFEPERGRYDETYWAYYTGLVDALYARGIGVIVDVHQDAFSRFATDGCGEGMPAWAISRAVTADVPDNGPDCSSWGIKFILDGDTHRSWDDFYADANGVRARYLALLGTLATRLGPHPAVIGYDMLNEPWGDELTQIGPLYEDGARVIRAIDPDALLFVSPQALTSAGQDTELAKPSFDNFAYAPHYYDALVITLELWLGNSVEEPVEQMFQRSRSWGVPLFVGEFGAPAETWNGPSYMDAFYAALDRRLTSAAQWAFVAHWTNERKDGWNEEDLSISDGDGRLRENYRVRPYPARIPGQPAMYSVSWEPELALELAWTHDPALGEARIFAPQETLFAGQARAELSGDLNCRFEAGGLHVRCTSDLPGPKRVRIVPCASGAACLVEEPALALPAGSDAGAPAPPPMDDAGSIRAGASPIGAATPEAPLSSAPRARRAGCALHALHAGGVAELVLLLGTLALLISRRRH